MALDLRPLTLPELLDRSFSTYRHHVGLFVGIMAVPAVITLAYSVGLQLFQYSTGPMRPDMPIDQIMWKALPIFFGSVAFLFVYAIVYAFALGAITVAVAHVYKDQPVTVAEAYRAVRSQGWWLLLLLIWAWLRVTLVGGGVMVVVGIVAALAGIISRFLPILVLPLGMLVAFVVAAYFGVRYGVAVPAAVLENLGPNSALRRSVDLTEEYRGRIFLIWLCAIVLAYATATLLQLPFMVGAFLAGPGTATALVLNVIGLVLGTAGSTFTGPIMIIGLALAYYDLRIRKEALDLQMMFESIDAPRA